MVVIDENMIYVLDSTVFLEKFSDVFVDKASVTIYEVEEEIKDPYAKIRFDMLLRSGLSILPVRDESVNLVKTKLKVTGDKLSNTDIKVIALALDFKAKNKKVMIVTDDYGIQNTAKSMDLRFMALSQKGISRTLNWKRKCTACGADSNKDVCDICGSETKFVSKSKKKR